MGIEDFLSKSNVIAVVGVSRDKKKFGYRVWKTLVVKGFNVYGINPKADEIDGIKVWPTLSALAEEVSIPDVVILVVPPSVSEVIVDESHRLGIKRLWFQPGSESEGALKKAEEYGMEVVYGKCFIVDGLKTEFVV